MIFLTKIVVFNLLHFNQSRMALYKLHHKLKWWWLFSPSDDDWLDFQEVQQLAPTRAWALSYERKFRSSWKIGRKWLMHTRPHGEPTRACMECYVCEEFCTNSPWGLGVGCKSMQNSFMCDHEKNDEHKFAVAKWEALHFPPTSLVFYLLIMYVQVNVDSLKKSFPFYLFTKHHNFLGQSII